jgi:hypothetical protein
LAFDWHAAHHLKRLAAIERRAAAARTEVGVFATAINFSRIKQANSSGYCFH